MTKKDQDVAVVEGDQVTTLTPNQLIAEAIAQDLDLEKIEKLMDLQERYEKREAQKMFNQAMNEFQANKPELVKTNQVAFKDVKFRFIPLGKIQKLVDPVLSKYGLSYTWKQKEEIVDIIDPDNKKETIKATKYTIICEVKHKAGHVEKSELSSLADPTGSKNPIQAIGSAVSYLKRYTLKNALGLSADEDDDGMNSFPSVDEVKDLQLEKVMDLYMEKQNLLTEAEQQRI